MRLNKSESPPCPFDLTGATLCGTACGAALLWVATRVCAIAPSDAEPCVWAESEAEEDYISAFRYRLLTVQERSGSYKNASSMASRLLRLSRSTPIVTIDACLYDPLDPGVS